MNAHRRFLSWLAQLSLVWLLSGPGAQAAAPLPGGGPPNNAIGTAITYQGQLKQSGGALTAVCDMAFRLYDAAQAGMLAANPITTTVPVTNGLFTVGLDFGVAAFTGDARFLETRVRCPAGSGGYTTLSPRTTVTAAPTALTLRSGAVISGTADPMLTIRSLQSDGGLALQVNSIDDGIDIFTTAQYGRGLSTIANGANGTGLYAYGGTVGASAYSPTGTGLSGRSDTGTALFVNGDARQTRADGGLVKALALVTGGGGGGSISRCYNGQVDPPASTAPCGFSLATSTGTFTVTFGFTVSDRFFSVTPLYETNAAVHGTVYAVGSNYVVVKLWNDSGALINSAFFIEVY